jgi:hypothetical protein
MMYEAIVAEKPRFVKPCRKNRVAIIGRALVASTVRTAAAQPSVPVAQSSLRNLAYQAGPRAAVEKIRAEREPTFKENRSSPLPH